MTKAKTQQKLKYKRAPCAPKRFKSGYMFYSEHQHKVIRSRIMNKKIRAADAAKMVSQSWKKLSDDDKAQYLEKGRIDRERYEREKATYKGPWKVPDVRDPNGPKKPMSAFLAFGNERRKGLAAANPSLTGTDISSLLSKLWRECPAEVKQSYRDREAREREQFKKNRAEWDRQKDLAMVEAIMSDQHSAENSASPGTAVAGGATFNTFHQNRKLPPFVIPKNIFTMGPKKLDVDGQELLKNLEAWSADKDASCATSEKVGSATSGPLSPTIDHVEQNMLSEAMIDACLSNDPFSLDNYKQPQAQNESQSSRFDRLSWDEILQNDELFEDFPASEVMSGSSPRTAKSLIRMSSLCSFGSGLSPSW